MIVKDDYSRFSWSYFLRQVTDSAEALEYFLADMRHQRTQSKIECIGSDIGGEFAGGALAHLSRDRGIRREFILADTSKLNGVARRIHLVQEAAQAVYLETP